MRIVIKDNLKELSRSLTRIQREQVPFAASMALNELAADVANEITRQMEHLLDRPTPFTLKLYQPARGKFYGTRANKRNLTAVLDPSATAAGKARMEYMKYQIDGGTRLPTKTAILVPTRVAPRNKFGNVSKTNREKMITKSGNFFSAGQREGKTPGIYKRETKGRIQPYAFYVDSANYKPILPVDKIAVGVVKSKFNYRFNKAMQKALATAR